MTHDEKPQEDSPDIELSSEIECEGESDCEEEERPRIDGAEASAAPGGPEQRQLEPSDQLAAAA